MRAPRTASEAEGVDREVASPVVATSSTGGSAKRPTIDRIAREAGVSTAAVSYALNGLPGVSAETRVRVLEVADLLGWRPNIAARSLSVARAHAIGLVIARPADTLGVEPFFMRFISGLESELAQAGSALLLQVVDNHRAWNKTVEQWWAERRIDGVIVTDVWHRDSRFALLERLRIPAVIAGRPQRASTAPAVWSDDDEGVRRAVDHLVALGHVRIARVAGLPSLDHTRVRTAAFTKALRGHDLSGDDVVDTDYSWEQGAAATRELLERPYPPTAIMFDNDLMTVAALNVARELGVRVPDELSLVAGDDSPLCLLADPTITALSRDVPKYGAQTARTLLDRIDGVEPRPQQVESPHLERRGSTAAPQRSKRAARAVAP
jgi:DNA-binding LacI/PurR family transcriptional regulator